MIGCEDAAKMTLTMCELLNSAHLEITIVTCSVDLFYSSCWSYSAKVQFVSGISGSHSTALVQSRITFWNYVVALL